jgi:hypothetical protein
MGNFVKVNVATTARTYEAKIYNADTTTFRTVLRDAGCDGLSTDWSMSGTPVNDLDATLGSMGFTSGSYQLTPISKRKNA